MHNHSTKSTYRFFIYWQYIYRKKATDNLQNQKKLTKKMNIDIQKKQIYKLKPYSELIFLK